MRLKISKIPTYIVLIGLILAALISFFTIDSIFSRWRVVESLPGDIKELLEICSQFGHGGGSLVAVILIWNLDRKQRHRIPLLVCSTLLAGTIATVMKVSIPRARPFYQAVVDQARISEIDQSIYNNGMQSFPSGHTATAFAMAGALTILYPQGRRLFLSLAILVGVQRIVAQNHFPSDVFIGALIGIVSVKAVSWISAQSMFDFSKTEQRQSGSVSSLAEISSTT